jgi:hypothetical protein
MGKKLKLRAEDEEDLSVISACLQDALIAVGDIKFLPEDHRFVLIANRFCWEAMPCPQTMELSPDDCFERVHTGLRFENVTGVRHRGIDKLDAAELLELLAIRLDGKAVTLVFAGDAAIRIETDQPLCFVEDLDEPWPTKWRPRHAVDEIDGVTSAKSPGPS